MQIYLQTVAASATKIKKKFEKYVLGLMLTRGLKNCASMARELFTRAKIYYDYLKLPSSAQAIIKNRLVEISKSMLSKGKCSTMIIDSTFLPKPFGKLLANLWYYFNGVGKRVDKGLCIVVIAITDGKSVSILNFKFYLSKKIAEKDYRTKIEIAKQLIEEYYTKLNPDYICMDGGFMSENMIRFLKLLKAKYIMRIPCNRLVMINNTLSKLSLHPKLRLIKNQRSLAKSGYYKGLKCFFTIQKRKKRNGGHRLIFLISNIKADAKFHLKLYSNRWPIEKSFRTMKQKLGFSECRMVTNSQQTLHILTVFFTYSLLELEKIYKRKKSVDDIINSIRFKNEPPISKHLYELITTFT